MSSIGFIVVLAWNVAHPDSEAGNSRPEAYRRPRPVTGGDTVLVTARPSSLRYLGPPPVFTPAHGYQAWRAREGGPVWVQGSPSLSRGTCPKCGEPMSRHSYYGLSLPCEVSDGPAHGACLSCGCATSVVSTGGAVALCPDCGTGRRIFISR